MDDDANVSTPNSQIQKLLDEQDASPGEDRISKLPDDILHHILSFCTNTTNQVIKTSILSKRWQYLWFSIPDITLRGKDTWCQQNQDNFFKTIDRAFQLRNAHIRKFYLILDRFMKSIEFDRFRLSSWLLTALSLEVQELCLSLHDRKQFELPSSLFTSKSLTYLDLRMDCSLKAPSPVCFLSLRVLRLRAVTFEDEQSTQELVSGLPFLEELEIDECLWDNIKTITIDVPTLRRFTFIYTPAFDLEYSPFGLDYSLNSEIKINIAADLDYFYCSTFVLVELLPCNMTSLEYASVDFVNCFRDRRHAGRAMKILDGLSKAKILALSSATLKCLSAAENAQTSLPVFHNLTHLIEVSSWHAPSWRSPYYIGGAATLIDILQKAPNLEVLSTSEDSWWVTRSVSVLKSSLKSFVVSFCKGSETEVFSLKYVCENAPELRRVCIFCSNTLNKDLSKQEEIRYQLQHVHGGELANFEIQFYDSKYDHYQCISYHYILKDVTVDASFLGQLSKKLREYKKYFQIIFGESL